MYKYSEKKVLDGIAYVADGIDGLEIIDVTDHANPAEIGNWTDGGNVRGVYVSGGILYPKNSKFMFKQINKSVYSIHKRGERTSWWL